MFPEKEMQSFFRVLTKNLAPEQTKYNYNTFIIKLIFVF